ncbi:MAG: pantetheine-phosphate adenylyltransferase [Rikenellaceae bacterium]
MNRVAIFPGSFDPFTRGHAAIVEEALRLFDHVVIAIGHNTTKSGFLEVTQRKRLIDDTFVTNERVSCQIYTCLTGDFATQVGACAMIRGVRNTIDFEQERILDAANRRLYPHLTTIVMFTPASVADISSTGVRELIAFGCDVDEFMPEGVKIKNYM